MKIAGLQKMTLLDYPGKVACTVFLGGCNFRCPYCHNAELFGADVAPVMDEEELLSFLKKRKGLLDAVCISGGEPTLTPQLPRLLEQIKAMGYLVKLDTNGSRPQVLKSLVAGGLVDYVAMDIKNGPEQYRQTALAPVCMEDVEQSICFLCQGTVDYEFRTTVVSPLHTAESVRNMGQWVQSLAKPNEVRHWYVQPFVDRDTVLYSGFSAPKAAELSEYVAILRRFSEHSDIRG